MAKLLFTLATQIFLLVVAVAYAGENDGNFARTINRKHIGFGKKEKLTHLRVYWHDISGGPNPSSITIQPPVSNHSASFFGSINMIDDALTTEVPINSTVVGQAQGMFAAAAQKEIGLLMVMNFAFKTGKYKGSTITILGRNTPMLEVREMPVVGGSGFFRFARGYVEARTKWLDLKTGNATVEYNCYVLHY